MKFIHISDLHIGLHLMNRDLLEDQRFVLNQITTYIKQNKVDAILIAGDIFDKSIPAADAVELFDTFMNDLHNADPDMEICVISGNHDSKVRLDMYREILGSEHIHMIGKPPETKGDHMAHITLTDEYGPVTFWMLPYVKPNMVFDVIAKDSDQYISYEEAIKRLIQREPINPKERNVFIGHQFFISPDQTPDKIERADSESVIFGNADVIKADVLDIFDYAALGHIHKPMALNRETVRYSGTPLAYSFSEAEHEKGFLVIEMKEKGNIKIEKEELKPLRKMKVVKGSLQEVLSEASDDYASVTLSEPSTVDKVDRIRAAFPNLLSLKSTYSSPSVNYASAEDMVSYAPMDMCRSFLQEMTDKEEAILTDIINSLEDAS